MSSRRAATSAPKPQSRRRRTLRREDGRLTVLLREQQAGDQRLDAAIGEHG